MDYLGFMFRDKDGVGSLETINVEERIILLFLLGTVPNIYYFKYFFFFLFVCM